MTSSSVRRRSQCALLTPRPTNALAEIYRRNVEGKHPSCRKIESLPADWLAKTLADRPPFQKDVWKKRGGRIGETREAPFGQAPAPILAMPVDLRLEELKSELCAARDELDRWVDKQVTCLQTRKGEHQEEIVRSNGAERSSNLFSSVIFCAAPQLVPFAQVNSTNS